jgi:uncharacterized short protein YbdD (DUF466 family)
MRKRHDGVSTLASRILRRAAETARLMIGVPDYQVYVHHRLTFHPEEVIMTHEEFFRDRQVARCTVSKGRFKGCC